MFTHRTASAAFSAAAALVLLFPSTVLFAELALPPVFRFDPPDGTTFVVKDKTTAVVTTSVGTRHTESSEIHELVRISKTEDGYMETHKPTRVLMLIDGKPPAAGTPLYFVQEFLRRSSLTGKLDRDGMLVDLSGLEEAIKATRRELSLDSIAAELLTSLVNKVGQNVKDEQNYSLLSVLGRSTKTGASWKSTDFIALPTGSKIEVPATYRVVGPVKHSGKRCVRVQCSYTADSAMVRDYVDVDVLPEVAELTGRSHVPGCVSRATLTGRAEIVIDPSTLLYYQETEKRTLDIVLSMSSTLKAKVTLQLWRKATYTYTK